MFFVIFLPLLISLVKCSLPRIELHPNSLIVNISDPVTLECRALGEPKPKITWFKDGQLINIDHHKSKYTLIHESNLFIFSAALGKFNKSDSGVYYCKAENEHGSVTSHNATLSITFLKDDFRDVPKSRQVNSGTQVIMECKAPKGQPEPQIYWLKNNQPLTLGHNYIQYPNGTLLILNTSLNENGEYVCIARNDAGFKRTPPAYLNVFEKPNIINHPDNSKFNYGERVELKCDATGFPKPQIEWKKDNSFENIPQKFIIQDNVLIIPGIDYKDEAEYTCVATNQLASVEHKFFISVYERPSFNKLLPNITVGIEGKSLVIECNARGRPQPVIYWAKSAQYQTPITQDDFVILENGNLFIEKLSKKYEGIYLCQASNEFGNIESKTSLQVKSIQLKPPPIILYQPQNQTIPINTQANLECFYSSEEKVTIKWFKDNKELNLINSLKYRVLESGELIINLVQKIDSGFYSCSVGNSNGETKSFISYLNVENPNNQFIEFQRNHESTALPSPPSRPVIFKITPRGVTLSWQGISHSGHSQIKNFIIEYFSPEWLSGGWTILKDDIPPHVTSYQINNLNPDTYYMFTIRARNSQGYGPASQPTELIRTQFEPVFSYSNNRNDLLEKALTGEIIQLNEPAEVLTSTSINITWKLFKSAYLIQGFYIKYKPIGQKEYLIEDLPTNKYSYFVLNNLQKYTTYEILVEPYSGSIKGSESNVIQAKTLEDIPSHSPVNLQLEIINQNSISIKWQPAPLAYSNGIILGYRITCIANETKYNLNLNTNSTTRAIIIGNLINGMKYCVKIAAFNKIGNGPYTALKCLELKSEKLVTEVGNLSSIIQESWFLGLISLILGTLVLLCVLYVVWLFYKRRLLIKKSNSKKYLSNNSTLLSDSRIDKNGNRYKLVGNDTQVWLDTMSDEKNPPSPGPQYAEVYAPANPYATSGVFINGTEQNLYNILSYQQQTMPNMINSSYTIKLLNEPEQKKLIKYLQSTQSQSNTPKVPIKLQQRVKSVENSHLTVNMTQAQLINLINSQYGYQPSVPMVPPPSIPPYVQTWSDPNSNSSSLVSNLTSNSTLSRNGSTFTAQQYVNRIRNNNVQTTTTAQDYSSISPDDELVPADEFRYITQKRKNQQAHEEETEAYLNLESPEQQTTTQNKKFMFLNQPSLNQNEIYISDEMPQTVL